MVRNLAIFLVIISRICAADGVGAVFFGDFGQGNSSQRETARAMAQYCQTQTCDFVMGLGDNFYPKGVQSAYDKQWKTKFLDMYEAMGLVFYATLGNHDYLGNSQAQIEYSKLAQSKGLWHMPSRYYQFSKGNADFFAIDTVDFKDSQVNWLKRALSESTARWKVVYGHYPVFSYGMHGDTVELVTKLLPVLRDHQVDFYISGHDHDRQYLEDGDKPVFAVSGAVSESRPVSKGVRTKFGSSELGFGYLWVEETKASLRFISKDGQVDFEKNFSSTSVANRKSQDDASDLNAIPFG